MNDVRPGLGLFYSVFRDPSLTLGGSLLLPHVTAGG